MVRQHADRFPVSVNPRRTGGLRKLKSKRGLISLHLKIISLKGVVYANDHSLDAGPCSCPEKGRAQLFSFMVFLSNTDVEPCSIILCPPIASFDLHSVFGTRNAHRRSSPSAV